MGRGRVLFWSEEPVDIGIEASGDVGTSVMSVGEFGGLHPTVAVMNAMQTTKLNIDDRLRLEEISFLEDERK